MLDDTSFSKPMPFVGVYIASATLLCVVAMLADLINGIRNKQYWIPSRYFSLNAAFIAILGVAIKLSVDFTTAMPGQLAQLAKLGTSAFLLIVLVAFIPSVPKLEKSELLANVVGLTIVVITSIVDICIQLETNVIYMFKEIHKVFLCSIVVGMLDISICGTYWRDNTKSRYETQHQIALKESLGDWNKEKVDNEKLKEYLINFTLMAHSGCPHFVVARSTFYCFVLWSAIFLSTCLFIPNCSTLITKGKYFGPTSTDDESDYGLSVVGILITQIIAMIVALVVQSVRMVYICRAHLKAPPMKETESLERQHFWMHNLEYLQFNPFNSYINYKYPMLIVIVKYLLLFLGLGFGFINRVILAPVIAIWKILLYYFTPSVSSKTGLNSHTASILHPDLNFLKLRPYVLYRKGEERLSEMLMESALYVIHIYTNFGRKREAKHLVELLDNNLSCDFGGVVNFDMGEIPPLNPEGSPPNCWALPVVTLTSIAIALPNIDHNSISKLIKSVKQGFLYVKIIENDFGDKHDLSNIKATASIAWAGVDLRRRWLDVDLTKLALQNRSPLKIVETLSVFAKENFPKMMRSNMPKAIAAHSMYKICQTLLQEYRNENNLDELSERIFKKVCINISDILGACFTNLKRLILLECSRSSPQKRREAAYRILKFFGETEKIMKIVEQRDIPNLNFDQMGFIDEWRVLPRSL